MKSDYSVRNIRLELSPMQSNQRFNLLFRNKTKATDEMNLGEQCGESLTRLYDSGKLYHLICGQSKGVIQDDLSKKIFQNFFLLPSQI